MGMRVLLASSSGNLTSGASWSMLYLTEYLQEKGCEVTILIPRPGTLEEECRSRGLSYRMIQQTSYGWFDTVGIKLSAFQKFVKYPLKWLANLAASVQIDRLIRQEQFDIVHLNTIICFLPAKSALKYHKKLVWHIREFMEEDLKVEFVDKSAAYALMDQADAVVAISRAIKEKFQPFLSQELRLIYNGVDPERFYTQRTILQGETVTVCMAGRIIKEKGQHQLIEAAMRLMQDGLPLRVQFIGNIEDEAYYNDMKQRIDAAGCADRFDFVGFSKNVNDYFKQADVICVCSRKEAFGRVTVEGMMSGALVIGSNTGGTKELIDDGVTGLLYEEEDVDSLESKLRFAAEQRETANRMAQAGQSWAMSHFTAAINADNIYKLYEELLQQ